MDQVNPLAEMTHKRKAERHGPRRSLKKKSRIRGQRRALLSLRKNMPH
jgi:DNA-directed RNA polymerase beta subunit